MRHFGEPLRVFLDQLEELAGPTRVLLKPAALAVHLVRQSAGGHERRVEVLGITLDRLAQACPSL